MGRRLRQGGRGRKEPGRKRRDVRGHRRVRGLDDAARAGSQSGDAAIADLVARVSRVSFPRSRPCRTWKGWVRWVRSGGADPMLVMGTGRGKVSGMDPEKDPATGRGTVWEMDPGKDPAKVAVQALALGSATAMDPGSARGGGQVAGPVPVAGQVPVAVLVPGPARVPDGVRSPLGRQAHRMRGGLPRATAVPVRPCPCLSRHHPR